MPKQLAHNSTSGVKLVAKPNKTTTVLGSYKSDMKQIINELHYPKTLDFEAKQGGFNVLNTPDELYKTPDQFWTDYNKPFLDNAINRGDDIVLTTKPTDTVLRTLNSDGTFTTTGFGKEISYLESKGYRYDASTNTMIKG